MTDGCEEREGMIDRQQSMATRLGGRFGFTLTEVLVVTVIIGILIALVSAAVFPALDSAKEFAIYSEAANLSMAMESFKSQYGATPPSDLSDTAAVNKFFSRAFPRYDLTSVTADLTAAGANTTAFDPGNALVFWLVGFHSDASNPLQGHSGRMTGGGDRAFYEFDIDRLAQGTSNNTAKTGVRYFPNVPGGAISANQDRAFLYWDRSAYTVPGGTTTKTYLTDRGNDMEAYQKSAGIFYNPRSFQIIQAGLDGTLMPTPVSPNLPTDTDDNIASFSGGTIKDFKAKSSN